MDSTRTLALAIGLVMSSGSPNAVASPKETHASASNSPTNHWSFQPVQRPEIPAVSNPAWVRQPIDAFVLSRLEKESLQPSPEADRATLIRRLSLDLLGLPPRADDVADFVADDHPGAYEALVDRLLASPHFGEQWGRHWLDLARYADSDGYEKDSVRPYAWRYRDWVIDAINRDVPFDQFTWEQLAGDLLPDTLPASRIATGFHRNTLTNKEGGVDQEEFRCKAVADRVSTTATVWLGLTVGCAECHDHKYDPISQRDFFQLFAFFNNADEKDVEAPTTEDAKAKAQVLEQAAKPRKTHTHVRGDFLRLGEEVRPGTLSVLPPMQVRGAEADRLDLAHWLTHPSNPLTRRVTVNRMWGHLFGRPLVATTDDFGRRGERPAHPELLDWLADELLRLGWSRKALIRALVTSSTYRQSSRVRGDQLVRDPLNILVSRQDRIRLMAENVRDAALAASGLLVERVGGPSVRPPLPADIAALGYADSVKWLESQGADRYRRGLYTLFQRTVPYPMLMTFDAPDANVTCTRRERSNTPLQALTLLNDPVFFECARALGRHVFLEEPRQTSAQRIRRAFELCLSRTPTGPEWERLHRLGTDQSALLEQNPGSAESIAGEEILSPGDAREAAALIAVCRMILNLDEFVTRE